jgi:hypothetical protein
MNMNLASAGPSPGTDNFREKCSAHFSQEDTWAATLNNTSIADTHNLPAW